MKQLLTTYLIFCLMTASAQVQGNFKQRAAAPESNLQQQNVVTGNVSQGRGYNNEATVVDENVIEFKIDALANQKADSYTAIFNVVQLGKTAEETNAALTNRLSPFVADMLSFGIKKEDIYPTLIC